MREVDPFEDYDEETLAAIDGWAPPSGDEPPQELRGWRRTSATGAVLGAAMLGLGDVVDGRRQRERPPIVADDPGEPFDPDALVVVELDADSPAATVAFVRRPRRSG